MNLYISSFVVICEAERNACGEFGLLWNEKGKENSYICSLSISLGTTVLIIESKQEGLIAGGSGVNNK